MSYSSSASSSDFEDESSQQDPAQFRRIYERELRAKQQREEAQRQTKARERQGNNLVPKSISSQVMQKRERGRSRSRSREKLYNKEESTRWFIYERAPKIEYAETLPSQLRKLSIFNKQTEILESMVRNPVILVTGDTGCGKSTQVPRMIYEYLNSIKSSEKIICVQPRRLAVTSLQDTVEKQLRHNYNHNQSSKGREGQVQAGHGRNIVGYQIGQKANFNSSNRIVFMTNGIFLQRIVHNIEFLEEYPFVILDEVHERDIDTDFILTALKRVIRKFPKLRIILMSATIDNELFRYYFASDHIDSFMEDENFYKKVIRIEEEERHEAFLKKKDKSFANQDSDGDQDSEGHFLQQWNDSDEELQKRKVYEEISLRFIDSKYPCPAINVNEPSNFKRSYFYLDTLSSFVRKQYNKRWGSVIFSHSSVNVHRELYEVVFQIVDQIEVNSRRQRDLSAEAILIFVPGLAQIESLSESLVELWGGVQKARQILDIIHVHSSIMTEEVERRLQLPNSSRIKVIISTNIAESSITVRGVKYIIDFCLTKEVRFDNKSKMENLELVWASKASCRQRAGRTGRVCDGFIFRLVEQKFFDDKLAKYSEPEIRRSSLDKLILRIKLMHENDDKYNLFRDPPSVLGTCIQPPALENIESSIASLKFCGAIEKKEVPELEEETVEDHLCITDLGRLYVDLPIDISYSKMLVFSILLGTFEDILILVSALSQNKNPFRKKEVEKNYLQYFDKMQNDQHCDFYSLVKAFKDEQKKHSDRFNSKNSHHGLRFDIRRETQNTIDDLRKRFERRRDWFNAGSIDGSVFDQSDYNLRFRLTLCFGFIDKFVKVKPPMYDQKQEKRLIFMKKYGIETKNTIVLLNSTVLAKQSSYSADENLKNKWKGTLRRSLHLREPPEITFGSGLTYLHFPNELDLVKLLHIKNMYALNCRRNDSSFLSNGVQTSKQPERCDMMPIKDVLQSLGDLDHMEQGQPVTLHKQNHMIIDQSSLNRVVNINEGVKSRYLITNSIMQQNNSLISRFSSLLKQNIAFLHVKAFMLFWPSLTLIPNKSRTAFSSLGLKKNLKVRIQYDVSEEEVHKANFIREKIRQFLSKSLEINSQNCLSFYKDLKQFVLKKRRKIINEEKWQKQFLAETNQSEIFQSYQKTDDTQRKIVDEKEQTMSKALKNQVICKRGQNKQTQRVFMNQIPVFELKNGVFSSNKNNKQLYAAQMSAYLEWKKKKLQSIDSIQEFLKNTDTYLCCGEQNCLLNLCKLKRVGPTIDDTFRELFEPVDANMVEVSSSGEGQAQNQQQKLPEENDFMYHLSNLDVSENYKIYVCANYHPFGVKFEGESRIKILQSSNAVMKYPDGTIKSISFEEIDPKFWLKSQKHFVDQKRHKILEFYCWACKEKTHNYEELRGHFVDPYHLKNVEDLKLTLNTAVEQLQSEDFEYFEPEKKVSDEKTQKVENMEIQY